MRTCLAVALAIVSVGKAHAVFLDGDTLRGWCTSGDAGDRAACLGYVVGVADVLISADGGEPARSEACIPAVETTQVVDVAKRYLESHRQAGDTAASDQVARALSEAFPCP